jgi:hypothetical protein
MADNWRNFPLPDGSYSDPARPWTDQDVVGYLPVRAEQQGTYSPVTYKTAPGLSFLLHVGTGPIRGIRDVEGALFVVSGVTLYEVKQGVATALGTVPGTGLVQMTHNQVVGGNQLVIANGSSGYVYDTRDESLINPAEPEEEPAENPEAPGGGEPSTDLGPNGGYPDDNEPDIPLPTTFGSELIVGGDFANPTDLDDWKEPDGDALTGWTISSGAAHYAGTGSSKAVYFPARYRMSPQPFPRYSVSLSADMQCSAGTKVAIGMMVGYSSAGDVPQVLYTSTPTEYLSSTTVAHTFDFKQQDAQYTVNNEWVYPNAVPVMYVYDESGAAITADFDNVSMTMTEVSTPVTSQSLDNLDFASGLTGWTTWPVGVGTAQPRVVGDELWLDSTTDTARFCWVVNDDPIDLADELNKYVHIEGEVWCNDPTLVVGIPYGGVTFGLIYRSPTGIYGWQPNAGAYERGDWTPREAWKRQMHPTANLAAGWTVHLAIGLRCRKGYVSKVRNVTVEVTDSAYS